MASDPGDSAIGAAVDRAAGFVIDLEHAAEADPAAMLGQRVALPGRCWRYAGGMFPGPWLGLGNYFLCCECEQIAHSRIPWRRL